MERQVRLAAGSLVLAGILASLRWPGARLLPGAVGAGLTFAALSNTCAMSRVLLKLPYNQTGNADGEQTVAALTGRAAYPSTHPLPARSNHESVTLRAAGGLRRGRGRGRRGRPGVCWARTAVEGLGLLNRIV